MLLMADETEQFVLCERLLRVFTFLGGEMIW